MFLIEGWDAEPDAMELPVIACIVCGRYIGDGDLIGSVTWSANETTEDRMTPALAWHVGRCAMAVDQVASDTGGSMGDVHTSDRLPHFAHNAASAPRAGTDGLLRNRRARLDLGATDMLLVALDSPLLRAAP